MSKRLYFIVLHLILTGILTIFVNSVYSQTYTMNAASNNVTYNSCVGTIYDSGGSAANYSSNLNTTIIFNAGVGSQVRLTFVSFNVDVTDQLAIYNGNGLVNPLSTLTGTALPGVITSTGQYLTLNFISDASTVNAGFRITVSCVATCSNTTVGGTIAGAQSICGSYNPTLITSTTAASGGSGTVSYQWESSPNGTAWTNIIVSGTAATYDPPTITETTHYRRKSKTATCGAGVFGATSNTIIKTVLTPPVTNAGVDQTKCNNAAFSMAATPLLAGQTGLWTVVSGTATPNISAANTANINFTKTTGSSTTLRWTVTSSSGCTASDDVVINNTTACSTVCTNPINTNGDLEDEGSATVFPLSFQSTTPAARIDSTITPSGWGKRFSNTTVNTSTFTGAYYLKKTGTSSSPHSGTHMAYLNGSGFCFSGHTATSNLGKIACGRTYRYSVWIAALTASGAQLPSNFSLEFYAGSDSGTPITYSPKINLVAPPSTSLASPNWLRYEFDVTIPNNGYSFIDFYITNGDAASGILIDDLCITELNSGSRASAGNDISACSNTVTLNANAVSPGYMGTWSVLAGNATFSSPNAPDAIATITSGTSALLNWTVSNGTCSSEDPIAINFSTQPVISVNNAEVCGATASTTLTASGCTGSLLWSTGATTNSITVTPGTTRTYSVTCTPTQSANLALNPGFESTTNFQNWQNWGLSSITTDPAEVRTGSKAVKINSLADWGSFAQDFNVIPGERYTLSAWIKTTNSNAQATLGVIFSNAAWSEVVPLTEVLVTSGIYTKYSMTVVVPPSAAYMQMVFTSGNPSISYIDDVEVIRGQGCQSSATSNVTVTATSPLFTTNAGPDQNLCNNSLVFLRASPLLVGESGIWTVESGTADIKDANLAKAHATFTGPTTFKWTVTSSQGCVASDQVLITNNTTCNDPCVNAINPNGDVEDEGVVTNFPQLLNGSPAALVTDLRTPPGWSHRYGSTLTDSANFLGAFFIKKSLTGDGNPHSGDNMVYINGNVCFSGLKSSIKVSCGKKYKVSAWLGAYTYNSAQINSRFNFELLLSSSTSVPSDVTFNKLISIPASTSWNNINWNRYEIEFEVPVSGYNYADFYFTTGLAEGGVLIDDLCITEISNGSESISNYDLNNCGTNSFTLNSNQPSPGFTGTWSSRGNNVSFSNINSPTAVATITTGDVATLKWSVANGGCVDSSNVTISKLIQSKFEAVGDTICIGENATIYAKNCTGNILWNNNSTANSLTVTPSNSTFYTATCSQFTSNELLVNPNFELTPALTGWQVSNASKVILASGLNEVQNGANATKFIADASAGSLYIRQEVQITPGKKYKFSAWGKAVNINTNAVFYLDFKNASYNIIRGEEMQFSSVNYQKYEKIFIAPEGSKFLEVASYFHATNLAYVDNFSLTEFSDCISIDTAHVLVYNTPIQLSTPVVGSCIPNAFTSMVPIDVTVSWPTSIPGDKIRVETLKKVQYIDVSTTTSPATVRFYVPANGSTNNIVKASWQSLNGAGCIAQQNYSTPLPCRTTSVNCSILYLMSNYNETDAEPFDQGLYQFLDGITTGSITKAFTKNVAGLGLFDPNNRSNPLALNLDNYSLIVISSSTEGTISTSLVNALRDFKGSIFNMMYEMPSSLGFTVGGNEYVALNEAYLSTGTKINPYEFNNTNPTRTTFYVTGCDLKTGGVPLLWFDQASAGTNNNAMIFKYPAHSIPGVTSTHGARASIGFSHDGFYSNSKNGGSIPAPSTSYFVPNVHFEYEVNKIFEQLIFDLTKCNPEICNNSIDDDGDALVDCFDPDCGLIQNREFDANVTSNWTLTNTAPAVSNLTLDATTKLSGVNSARIAITTGTATLSNIKFAQSNLSIVSGKTYRVTFRARSSTNRTISSTIIDTNAPATVYSTNNHSLLNTATAASNTFTYTFTATATNANASLEFNLGTAIGDIFIDDVRFGEVCCPAVITATPASRCGPGTLTLIASATGTINWYAAATGGSSLYTGTNFVTPSISTSTTYYVDVTNGCTSARIPVVATISSCTELCFNNIDDDGDGLVDCNDPDCPVPAITSVIPAGRCGSGSVTLSATSTAGTINWYSSLTGGTSLGSGTTFVTPNISSTTTYYVEALAFGCSSQSRTQVVATIGIAPDVNITGPTSICQDATTTLSPTTGGIWTSSNIAVATVTNAGLVTGVSAGSATFYFTNSATGCISDETASVTINAKPNIDVSASTVSLCIGETTTISPNIGGSWISTNPTIASINNSGLITALASGTTNFRFTQSSTGCTSNQSAIFTVKIKPSASITGSATICEGATTALSPTTGGTWASSNTSVAVVTNSGIVTGVNKGSATFVFTSLSTGCSSSPTAAVNISPALSVNTCVEQGVGVDSVFRSQNQESTTSVIPHPEIEGCTYNLEVKYGESFNIRDYVHIKDESLKQQVDWSQIYFSYTLLGANSPTVPVNWHLADFNNGNQVTVTSADAASGTGNSGNGQYRIYMYRKGMSTYDDHMEIRVQNSVSNINSSKCDLWQKVHLYRDIDKDNTFTSGVDQPHNGINIMVTKPSGSQTLTTNSSGEVTFSTQTGPVTLSTNITQLPSGTVIKPEIGATITFQATSSTKTLKPINTAFSSDIDLSLVTTVSNQTPSLGGTITVFVTVTNSGPSQATNVSVKDFFNPNIFTNINSISHNGILGTGQVTWSGITLNVGESIILSFTTTMPTTGVTNFRNFAEVTSATQNDTDSNYGNYDSELTLEDDESVIGISTSCSSDTICQDGILVIKSKVTGNGIIYQWESSPNGVSSWTNIVGANSARLNVPSSIIGTNFYRVSISSTYTGCGSLTSAPTRITVIPNPNISLSASSKSICAGSSTTLTAIPIIGGGIITYQWKYNSGTSIAPIWVIPQNGIPSGAIYTDINSTSMNVSGINADGNYEYKIEMASTGTGCNLVTSQVATINVSQKPIIAISGSNSICAGSTTTLSADVGGTWTSNNTSIATVSNSGLVTGISAGTASFTFTNSNGCAADQSLTIIVGSPFNASVDLMGGPCLNGSSKVSALASAGTAPFTYNWTGPSSFVANTQTADITNSGNYYVTITDSYGCSAATSGFIYSSFVPLVVNLQTDVCEGQTVSLNANNASYTAYLWGSNTGNSTNSSVTVTPIYPSSTYSVTITNNIGCTGVANATINVIAKPTISLAGPDSICIGVSTVFTPNTGGVWSSSNPAIASINNAGVVNGLSAGSATFTFTSAATNCPSSPSEMITVNPKPIVSLSGPNAICINSTTSFLPSSGGTWMSNNPSIASINNSGIVTGLSEGSATFVFTNDLNCSANNSIAISVDDKSGATISGDNLYCVGEQSTLTASKGAGTWSSSNTSVATISSTGLVTAISEGTATISYDHNSGSCGNTVTYVIIVNPKPIVSFTGPSSLCIGSTTSLSPITGGTWQSSNTSRATIDNSGIITALSAGTVNFTFTNTLGCSSNATTNLTINPNPIVSALGRTNLCISELTTLSPTSGGTWQSSNTSTATVTNNGEVTAIASGTASFTYTNTITGCSSVLATPINVATPLVAAVDFNGSQCLKNNSIITAAASGGATPYTFTWAGPNSFSSNLQSVSITNNGNYLVTITDAYGCSVSRSGFVYELFDPTIIGLQTQVCEGQSINLTAFGNNVSSYLWSSNANDATTSTVQVTPLAPTSVYNVIVTNNVGCTANLTATVNVNLKPIIDLTGPNTICIGSTTTLSPASGGSWTSSNQNVASINSDGIVTGLDVGTATFSYTNTSTGCISIASVPININEKTPVSITGSNAICIGSTTSLSPTTGGVWTSSNNAIATVSNQGIVTGVSDGTVTFNFLPSATNCLSDATLPVIIKAKPSIFISGSPNICVGETTNLLPNTQGIWTSSNSLIASITNAGLVTGLTGGNVTFTYTDGSGCPSEESIPIEIKPKPSVAILGNSTICIGGNTSLDPSTGGIWSSSNQTVATVNLNGMVTGVSSGNVNFTFTNSITNCTSDATATVAVKPNPTVLLTGPAIICQGTTTSFSPTTNGTWSSSNSNVASITNDGIVTGLIQGSATFKFTTTAGCPSNWTTPITVNPKPSTVLIGSSNLCIGEKTQFFSSSVGVWTSNNPSIATISNTGLVTAISEGTATFKFTENNSGCTSDNTTPITVIGGQNIGFNGLTTICAGTTTTLFPSSGGSWTSSNPNIASVSSNGYVNAITEGTVTFTFINSTSGCIVTTSPLSVLAKPTISVSGPTAICNGNTTQLNASTGGIWTPNNPLIASVSVSGLVTGISSGSATFYFTNSSGCSSSNSLPINVFAKPIVNVSGDLNICIGSNTTLTPSAGGIWTSNNPGVASVSNSGVVTGIASGAASFIFTETNSGCSAEIGTPINVNLKPVITINGGNALCVGSTTNLTSNLTGSWASSNAGVATISNTGLVTAVNQGIVTFTFTSLQGCLSNPSLPITVSGKPTIVITGSSNICVGNISSVSPTSGGTWVSTNNNVATITNQGIITGISAGTTKFIFTESSTNCISSESTPLEVNESPIGTLNGSPEICIGGTTNLSPSTGGFWTSTNNNVASVTNMGQVTGISSGTANFIFTKTSTGCSSSASNLPIIVNPKPTIDLSGPPSICIGTTTLMTSTESGTWQSKNPTIASISTSGTVTGLAQGLAKFTFTNNKGCISPLSLPITVNPKPSTFINGPANICIGSTTTLLPNSNGTWTSLNPSIATISNNGTVTGIYEGAAFFSFQDATTGCIAETNSAVNVITSVPVSIDGPNEICVGQKTNLLPSTGGIWTSLNPSIAKVTSSGEVVGITPGKVSFSFLEISSECISYLEPEAVTVVNCIDPDFNVTTLNTIVNGNVSTNDDGLLQYNRNGQFTYLTQPLLKSKPLLSTVDFTIQSDGSYSFKANLPGQYRYTVGACFTPDNCTYHDLSFTVIDEKDTTPKYVANTDIATVYADSSISINTMYNDKCINAVTCNLVASNMNVSNNANHGNMNKQNLGWMKYWPSPGWSGVDSSWYNICSLTDPQKCKIAQQIVTVNHASALNSTVGADDFFYAFQDTLIVGNLLWNDSDPEKDIQSATPQGSPSNEIQIAEGSYYLESNGTFKFTPNDGFYGPVDIVYEVCDNNLDQFCTKATAHLLIIKDMSLRLKVYLEGSLSSNGNALSASGKPLMRDNLRNNTFTGLSYIPANNPYRIATSKVKVTSKFPSLITGDITAFDRVSDSIQVFSITGDNAIVDWVFIELRSKTNRLQKLCSRGALLQRDGDVVDIDGISNVRFPRMNEDSFYVVIRHRNHLGAMSMLVSQNDLVDFTSMSTPLFDFGTVANGSNYTGLATNNKVKIGYRSLWAGDFDANGKLKFTNPTDDQNILFFDVVSNPNNVSSNANYNFSIGYYQGDFNMNGKSKYDNPNDDKNLLFSQILLYPLNTNFISNYNFLIEQVPK
jgi:trimeric autotransporter adhesin